MELRHLRYFVTVAEELNFRRAAQRLYMEQPPLSRQIRQLEEEIDVELFHRTKRGVTLTEAGQAFLEQARLTLSQAEQAVQAAKQADKTKRASLTVGFSICAFSRVLPEIVQAFRQGFPDIDVNLIEIPTPSQVQALMANEIEIGFLHLPINQDELMTETLLREPVMVVLPETHPLAALPSVSLRSLANEPFVLFPRHIKPEFYEHIMSACQQAGFQPKVVQEVTPPDVAVSFVGAGAGVSLVAAGYQNKQSSGVVFRTLEEPTAVLEIGVAWRQGNSSPVLSSFLNIVRKTRG
jgi:DNA-binding transcriptional LysR family regulator